MIRRHDFFIVIALSNSSQYNGSITLQLQGDVHGKVFMQVMDQYGRTVLMKQLGDQHTTRLITPVNLNGLPKGNYILKVLVGDKPYLNKLLIQ